MDERTGFMATSRKEYFLLFLYNVGVNTKEKGATDQHASIDMQKRQ